MARKLGYLILVVLGIAFAILYTQYSMYQFVGILILFPLFSYLFAVLAGILLRIRIEVTEETVERGDEFKLSIKIKNRSIFPVLHGAVGYRYGYGVMKNRQKGKIPFQVKARGEATLTFTTCCEYCGTFHFSVSGVWIKDYLHVFSFYKRVKAWEKQVIFPKLELINLEVVDTTVFYNDEYDEFYEDHPGNDPSEIFEIREYREGDKLQRIHWKLSSKKDMLMVKEFSDPIVISSVVICDNECDGKGMELVRQWSELVQKTIQVSYSLLLKQVNHYVYWFDAEKGNGVRKEIKSEEDLNVCMKQLMQAIPYENSDDYVSYLVHSEKVAKYCNLFYVGQNHYERLEQQGVHVKVVD